MGSDVTGAVGGGTSGNVAGCWPDCPESQAETGAGPVGAETSGKGKADGWVGSPERSAESDGGVEVAFCWSSPPEPPAET